MSVKKNRIKKQDQVTTDQQKPVEPGPVIIKIPGPGGSEIEKRLTVKQENFCQAYLIDFNASKAARIAGYSEETAGAIASENLKKPEIRLRIQQLRDQMGDGFNITRERIALEYSRLAFLDPKKFYDADGKLIPVHLLDDDTAAALTGVDLEAERKIKSYSSDYDIDDEGNIVYATDAIITTVTKIRHTSKREALDSLTKLMGYAAPAKTELTTPGGGIIPLINLNVVQPAKPEDD